MKQPNLDMAALRSLVAGMELGSFARAADRVNRSTSAVSAQIHKLEEAAGVPLFSKAGRRLALTEAGELMLSYARRIVALNDEATAAVRGLDLSGGVRLGLQEEFGETILPDVLGQFARAHPRVRVEAVVARNQRLLERIDARTLDLALVWGDAGTAGHSGAAGALGATGAWGAAGALGTAGATGALGGASALGVSGVSGDSGDSGRMGHAQPFWQTGATVVDEPPMCWIGSAATPWQPVPGEPVPLATLDRPCTFHAAAIAALDRAGMAWRVSFTSPNLGGLWAAAAAGLGLVVRTAYGLPASVRQVGSGASSEAGREAGSDSAPRLPELGAMPLVLLRAAGVASPVADRLRDIVLGVLGVIWPGS